MFAIALFVSALMFFADTADPSNPTDLISYISRATGPVIMAVIIVGAIQEWWVPGRQHRRVVEQRDALLELALRSQEVGERALNVAGGGKK